jgi:hypothetical protein
VIDWRYALLVMVTIVIASIMVASRGSLIALPQHHRARASETTFPSIRTGCVRTATEDPERTRYAQFKGSAPVDCAEAGRRPEYREGCGAGSASNQRGDEELSGRGHENSAMRGRGLWAQMISRRQPPQTTVAI